MILRDCVFRRFRRFPEGPMILREGVFLAGQLPRPRQKRQEYLARKEPLLGWVIGDLPGNIFSMGNLMILFPYDRSMIMNPIVEYRGLCLYAHLIWISYRFIIPYTHLIRIS